jgi:hypothetical protein
MSSRCVNPQCAAQWDLFGAGALYVIERRKTAHSSRQREYIWLCASCAESSTLQTDATGNVVVVPQTRARNFARSDNTGDLRLVFRSTGVPLPLNSGVRKQSASMVNNWWKTGRAVATVSGTKKHLGGTYAITR